VKWRAFQLGPWLSSMRTCMTAATPVAIARGTRRSSMCGSKEQKAESSKQKVESRVVTYAAYLRNNTLRPLNHGSFFSERSVPMFRGHRDLKVFQPAYRLAIEIFHLTKQFPREEVYSLTDQIRRSSRSVAANLAEGFGRDVTQTCWSTS